MIDESRPVEHSWQMGGRAEDQIGADAGAEDEQKAEARGAQCFQQGQVRARRAGGGMGPLRQLDLRPTRNAFLQRSPLPLHDSLRVAHPFAARLHIGYRPVTTL